MRSWTLAAAAAVCAIGIGGSARAGGNLPLLCLTGCYASGGTTFPSPTDYTVPDDGLLYNWSFWTDSAHPDVLISVQPPNEIFGLELISTGGGGFDTVLGPDPWFTWEQFQKPGFTLVQVRGQPSYNDCAGAPAGKVCGYFSNIWGNGTSITVNTDDLVEIFDASSLAIPEPQTWLMMVGGLFGVGAVTRMLRWHAKSAAASA